MEGSPERCYPVGFAEPTHRNPLFALGAFALLGQNLARFGREIDRSGSAGAVPGLVCAEHAGTALKIDVAPAQSTSFARSAPSLKDECQNRAHAPSPSCPQSLENPL